MKIVTGKTGENHVTSSDARELNAGILGKGCYVLDIGSKLAYSVQTSNSIIISNGNIVMNGTQAAIPFGTNETVTIENGSVGYNRIDLIVARYQKSGGLESVSLEVIKGTPTASTPTAPTYHQGNILEGDTMVDMPLYSVCISGVNIDDVKQEFVVITGIDDVYRMNEVDTLLSDLTTTLNSSINSVKNNANKGINDAKDLANVAQSSADSAMVKANSAYNLASEADHTADTAYSMVSGVKSAGNSYITTFTNDADKLAQGVTAARAKDLALHMAAFARKLSEIK